MATEERVVVDHPFYENVAEAQHVIDAGGTVYQKFTCAGCTARQTMSVPNKFFTSGKCEECGHITDILVSGCNFLAVFGRESAERAEARAKADRRTNGGIE